MFYWMIEKEGERRIKKYGVNLLSMHVNTANDVPFSGINY